MATDNFGRPIETPDDLAAQMAQPVKQVGAGDVVAQLNALAQAQAAMTKKIEAATQAAIGGNEAIAGKLAQLEAAIKQSVTAAQLLNQQIKQAAKGGSSQDGLTETGVSGIMRRYSQPSPELKSIHATIVSKNTVHVKEKELRNLTKYLIRAVETLAAAVGLPKGAAGAAGGGGKGGKGGGIGGIGGGGSGGGGPPLGSAGPPLGGSGPGGTGGSGGGPPLSGVGPPLENPLAGPPIAPPDPGKKAKKNWRAIRSEEEILLNLAGKFFDTEKSRYKLTGENIEDHAFFQNQMKRHLFDQNGNLAITKEQLRKIIELEGQRAGLATHFTKHQTVELIKLRKAIGDAGDDDVKRNKAIKEYQSYMEKVTREAERQRDAAASNWEFLKRLGREITTVSERLHEMGYGFTVQQATTKDILVNHRKWVQESGELAFYHGTITSQIREQDSLMTGMSSSFKNNFVYSEAMYRTGKSLATLQQQQIKNAKKGIKDAALANRLAEKGVYLSTALGTNTEQTAETLRSWHMEMGLSEKSIAQVSIGLKGIGTSMGLVGDEMTKVVENTKRAMENMRNLGTLTATATTELMELNAAGQKFGVGTKTQEISEYLTGGITKLGDSKMNAGMFQALQIGARSEGLSIDQANALQQEMMFGELPANREGMRVLERGLAEMADSIARTTGAQDAKSMTADQRRQANIVAQAQGFEGIGQLQQLTKSMNEINMSYTDRLTKLQKDREKINESELSNLEKAQLNMDENNLKFAETTKLLSDLNEGRTLSTEDLKGFNLRGVTDPEQQSKALLQEMFKAAQGNRKEALSAGASQLELGAELSQEDLQKAMTGDPLAIEEFMTKANEADQRLTVTMKKLSNPITQQTMLLQEINDFLQTRFGGFIGWLTHNSIFRNVSTLAGTLSQMFSAQSSFEGTMPVLYNLLKTPLNMLSNAFGSKGPMSLMADMIQGLWSRATHKGSLYTHDIHVVKGLDEVQESNESIDQAIVKTQAKPKTQSVGKGDIVQAKPHEIQRITMAAIDQTEQRDQITAQGLGFAGIGEMQRIVLALQKKQPAVEQPKDAAPSFMSGETLSDEVNRILATSSPLLSDPVDKVSSLLSSMSSSVEQKVKEEQVGTDPDKKNSAVATDIGGVKDNTAETVEQLKLLVDQMKTFLTMMNTGGSSGGGASRLSTTTNNRPNIIFDYHTWQLGNHEGNASKGPVISDGLV